MCNEKPSQNEFIGNPISKMSHHAAVFNLYIQLIFTEITSADVASGHS